MKKIVSIFLAIFCSVSMVACNAENNDVSRIEGDDTLDNRYTTVTTSNATARWKDGSAYTPVLRFVAGSDVHIYPDPSWSEGRFERLFRDAYAYSSTQEYDRLDAVILNGDLCERGEPQEYERLMDVIKENTDIEQTQVVASFAGHEVIYYANQGKDKESIDYITGYTGNDACTHLAINGYHFIVVSNMRDPSQMLPEGYDNEWVAKQFATANADDPEKPIFSFYHHPVLNTVLGSNEANDIFGDLDVSWNPYNTFDKTEPDYKDVLENYPQTVQFSSHSHSSVANSMIVSQEGYTHINTGATNYMGRSVNGFVQEEQIAWMREKLDSLSELSAKKSYMIDNIAYDYDYTNDNDRVNYLSDQMGGNRFYKEADTKALYQEFTNYVNNASSQEELMAIYKTFLSILETYVGMNSVHSIAVSTMYLVEVDAKNRIRVMPYDLINGKFLMSQGAGKEVEQLIYYIEDAGDASTWEYTDERILAAEKPYFTEEAKADVQFSYVRNDDGLYTLDFDFPVAKDAEGVEIYWISVTEKGKLPYEGVIHTPYSSMYYMSTPLTRRLVNARRVELESGKTYQLIVQAKNFYGKMSDMENSIVYEFTVE